MPSDSLMTPSGVRFEGVEHHLLIGDGNVVDAEAAALDLSTRFAIGGDEARLDERGEHADAGIQLATRNFHGGQGFRDGAFLEGAPGRFGGLVGCVAPVQQRGGFRRQHLLGFVDLAALQRLQLARSRSSAGSVNSFRNLTTSASSALRQYCQKSYGLNWSALSQTAPLAVLPILSPDAVVSSGVVSANSCGAAHAAAEVDAVDDVAPLVRAAHLQAAVVRGATARRSRRPAGSCS